MNVRYLDYDLVVAINADHCGDGAGVRDEHGIRAQLGRASQTFLGEDLYPTLALKAAVLLHGLSSTQYFHDGNKRTAWLASQMFLELNAAPLRKIPPIDAEAFVLAVATRAFETDEERAERAIRKAAEWYTQMRFRMRDRLEYAFIAQSANENADDGNTFDVLGGQIGGIIVGELPAVIALGAVVRVRFAREDVYQKLRLRIEAEDASGPVRIIGPNRSTRAHLTRTGELPANLDYDRDFVDYDEGILLAFEDLAGTSGTGVIPSIATVPIILSIAGSGIVHVVFSVNGEFLARRRLEVRFIPGIGHAAEVEDALRAILGPR